MAIRGLSGHERAEGVLVRVFGVLWAAQYVPAGVAALSNDRSAYVRPDIVGRRLRHRGRRGRLHLQGTQPRRAGRGDPG